MRTALLPVPRERSHSRGVAARGKAAGGEVTRPQPSLQGSAAFTEPTVPPAIGTRAGFPGQPSGPVLPAGVLSSGERDHTPHRPLPATPRAWTVVWRPRRLPAQVWASGVSPSLRTGNTDVLAVSPGPGMVELFTREVSPGAEWLQGDTPELPAHQASQEDFPGCSSIPDGD